MREEKNIITLESQRESESEREKVACVPWRLFLYFKVTSKCNMMPRLRHCQTHMIKVSSRVKFRKARFRYCSICFSMKLCLPRQDRVIPKIVSNHLFTYYFWLFLREAK